MRVPGSHRLRLRPLHRPGAVPLLSLSSPVMELCSTQPNRRRLSVEYIPMRTDPVTIINYSEIDRTAGGHMLHSHMLESHS